MKPRNSPATCIPNDRKFSQKIDSITWIIINNGTPPQDQQDEADDDHPEGLFVVAHWYNQHCT